jgi:hypothetical protein
VIEPYLKEKPLGLSGRQILKFFARKECYESKIEKGTVVRALKILHLEKCHCGAMRLSHNIAKDQERKLWGGRK